MARTIDAPPPVDTGSATPIEPTTGGTALVAPPLNPLALLDKAIEKNLDVDKLDKFLAVYERWEKGEARKKYVAAMNEFKKNPPEIKKERHAQLGDGGAEYFYASLDEVVKAIVPALAKHDFSHHWETVTTPNLIRVTCILRHADGHSESTTMEAIPDSSGKKNPIQAQASAVTYLQRYTLLSITGLSATELDDDGKAAVIAKKGEAKKRKVETGKIKPSAEGNRGHGDEGFNQEQAKSVPYSGIFIGRDFKVKKEAQKKAEDDLDDKDYFCIVRTEQGAKKVDFFLWDTKFFDAIDGNEERNIPKAVKGETVEFLVSTSPGGKFAIDAIKSIGDRTFTSTGSLMGSAG